MAPIPFTNNIGKTGTVHMPEDRKITFRIVDEIQHEQLTSQGNKIFCLQKLEFDDNHHCEYRFCYYIIGKKPKMLGKWVFGQYAPIIPEEDLKAILQEAVRRGWL